MTTFINNLFPENSFEASMKLINTKKNIENSIRKYLEQYDLLKSKMKVVYLLYQLYEEYISIL